MKLDFGYYLPKRAAGIPIAPLAGRWRRLPATRLIGVGLVIALLCAVAAPALIGAAYLAAGVRSLADAGGAERAVASLEQARRWSPDDPAIYRALAQAYIRLGRHQAAIDAIEQAYRLQPGSLLIQQELAQAYEAAGDVRRADALWAEFGIAPAQMIGLGDQLYAQSQYKDALAWYTRAARLSEALPFDQLFKRTISAVLAGDAEASTLLQAVQKQDRAFVVYTLDDHLRIPGGELRWMTAVPSHGVSYGMPLSFGVNNYDLAKNSTGFMWWSGEALTVLSAAHDGRYRLDIRVRHSKPAPVEMAVGLDGQRLQHILLTRGDDSWEMIAVPLDLHQGLHTINVWYLNNAIVDGVDRDAAIEWLVLEESWP